MRGVRRSRRQLSRSNSSTPVSSLDYFDFGASKQSALASESQVSGSQVSEPKASEPVASSEPASVTPTDENSLLRVVEVESRPAKRRRLLHSASSELFDLSSKESFLVRRDGESQESYTVLRNVCFKETLQRALAQHSTLPRSLPPPAVLEPLSACQDSMRSLLRDFLPRMQYTFDDTDRLCLSQQLSDIVCSLCR
ncbi:MAG: hypothetical protein MHM6MM_007439 [Cercozoa sp. M6MM]